MTKYEDFTDKHSHITIEERPMINKGLYSDGCIWINKSLCQNEKRCILAEEVGHHETSVGNILDQKSLLNQKQEQKARVWAYNELLPESEIIAAASNGFTEVWEMAEDLEVTEEFLREALEYYGFLNA